MESAMKIAFACDHGGYPLKKIILDCITASGHSVIDLGTDSTVSVDYPDYAEKLGLTITRGEAERGILICGSGVGASIAANKIQGVYAAVCHDTYSAHQGVEHDNMNVLCLGARVIGPELAKELVVAFLNAKFSQGERHVRRVNKIYQIEKTKL
jgi:ribose 5-phosphate isomerase B